MHRASGAAQAAAPLHCLRTKSRSEVAGPFAAEPLTSAITDPAGFITKRSTDGDAVALREIRQPGV
jgi:hypothetical protein